METDPTPPPTIDVFLDWGLVAKAADPLRELDRLLAWASGATLRLNTVVIGGADADHATLVATTVAARARLDADGETLIVDDREQLHDELLRRWAANTLAHRVIVATRLKSLIEVLTFFVTLENLSPDRLIVVSNPAMVTEIKRLGSRPGERFEPIAPRTLAWANGAMP